MQLQKLVLTEVCNKNEAKNCLSSSHCRLLRKTIVKAAIVKAVRANPSLTRRILI